MSIGLLSKIIPTKYKEIFETALVEVAIDPSILDDMSKMILERLDNTGKKKFYKMCQDIKRIATTSQSVFLKQIGILSKDLSEHYDQRTTTDDSFSASTSSNKVIENTMLGGNRGVRYIRSTSNTIGNLLEILVNDLEQNPIDASAVKTFGSVLLFFFVLLFFTYLYTNFVSYLASKAFDMVGTRTRTLTRSRSRSGKRGGGKTKRKREREKK